MRIDAYHAITQVYQANQVNRKAAEKMDKAGNDRFEMSDFGKTLQVAKKAVTDVPEVREERIAEMKEQLEDGTYEVSNEELAKRITDKIFNGLF